MGQAAIDLPDPLDVPAVTGSAETDDLLSQLAGEEIDRLMAESHNEGASADAEIESAVPAPNGNPRPAKRASRTAPMEEPRNAGDASAAAPSPSRHTPTAAAPLAGPTGESPTTFPEQAPAVSLSEAELAAGIDDVFSQIRTGERRQGSAASTGADSVTDSATAEGGFTSPARTVSVAQAAIHAVEAEGLAGERPLAPQPDAVLIESSLAPVNATDASDLVLTEADLADLEAAAEKSELSALILTDEPTDSGPDQPAPLIVRVLELFNSPLAAFPESVREAMGKVAVITLVNALAVLAYVLIFRRH
ncbi:MAG: hypothetical protein JWO87_2369 [Phycisphaerales bacterium]|nr:hypothetical protein [Phycisphaerales bacterium]MDB5300706.1 hypothetical protein [Phycisphaerales bacterium]